MSPDWSIAMLPIQRTFLSGAKVPCWNTTGVPAGLRTSYQRRPLEIEWLKTRDSTPFGNWRYESRYMGRSPSASSVCVVPGCGTQKRKQRGVKVATGRTVGPVKVEFAGVVKST